MRRRSATYLAALRAVAGAAEELDAADLEDEIDRTALLGEMRSTMFRWEHERPNARNPSYWLAHLFQALYAVLSRSSPAAAGRATAVLERLEAVPAFLDSARATLDEPPSVFVDSALIMLGGGGQLIAQVTAAMADEEPALGERLRAAGRNALEALAAFGVALRDDVEPSPDPLGFAIGEEQFSRRLHFEHALVSGAPELWRYGLHLQEETEEHLAALAAELGPTPWRELVDRLRGDAAEGERARGLSPRARTGPPLRARSRPRLGPVEPGGRRPDAGIPGLARSVRRLRAAARLPR